MGKDTAFGRELVALVQEAAAMVRGEKEPAQFHFPLGAIDVRVTHEKLGLSRSSFAEHLGLAVAVVREWKLRLRRLAIRRGAVVPNEPILRMASYVDRTRL